MMALYSIPSSLQLAFKKLFGAKFRIKPIEFSLNSLPPEMNQETFFGKYYFSLKSIWCAPRWRIRFSAPRNISGEQANSLCSPSLSLSMTRTLTCTHTPMRTRLHLRPQYYRLSKITSRSECREREKENCLEAKVRGRKSEEKTTLSLSHAHSFSAQLLL